MDTTRSPPEASKSEGSANTAAGETSKPAEFQYCRHCGNMMPPNSTVCPYCGRAQLTTQPQAETAGRKRFESYVLKKMRIIRITAFLLCVCIFVAEILAGSQTPLSKENAQLIMGELGSVITADLSPLEIALNNILICLIFFAPVFGALFMASLSFNVGIVASALATLQSSRTLSEILLSTFLIPSAWLEISAYGLAASEGIMLLLGVLIRRFREEGKTLLRTILICSALLVVGAVIESVVISAGG